MTEKDEKMVSKAEMGISNAMQVQELGSAFATLGYTKERIAEGLQLVTTVRQVDANQRKEYGEQKEATAELKNKRKASDKEYLKNLGLARIALEGNAAAYTALGFSGSRKPSISGCIAQTLTFYSNLLNNQEWLEALRQFNISREILEHGRELAQQMETGYSVQMKEMGEAQQSTEIRDAAIDKLDQWYSTFIKVGRIALAGDPQLLEMLGIVAKN